jgi:hypothetical protein
VLNGPLHSTGTETFGADTQLLRFAESHVNLHALEIDEPTPSRMAIRVTDVVARGRSSPATLTYLCHGNPSLILTPNKQRDSSTGRPSVQ